MKKLFTLTILASALSGLLPAQSFTVTPNPSAVSASNTETDIENHVTLSNNHPFEKTLRWTRTEVYMSDPSLQSQVCDNIQCYLPGVSTKTFPLAGSEIMSMIVHLLNPNELAAQAIIHLKITNENVPSDSLTIVYTYDAVSGVSIPLTPTVDFLPNPTTDFIQLVNAAEVGAVRLYALDGRLVANRVATPDQRYDFSSIQAGIYVLALENKEGRLIQATELVKQ